jgi:hypothetical protein
MGRPFAYFLGKQGVQGATLLPEMLFLDFSPGLPTFNRKSAIGVKFSRKLLP